MKEQTAFLRSGDIHHGLAYIQLDLEITPVEFLGNYLAHVNIQFVKGDFAAALDLAESLQISDKIPDSVWAKPMTTARAAWLLGRSQQSS